MEHVTDDCQCEGKKCKDCQEVKCLGHYKAYSKRSSLKPRCWTCDKKNKYAWAKANPDKDRSIHRKFQSRYQPTEHEKNLRRENARRWNKAHPEIAAMRIRKHQQENRERYNLLDQIRRTRKTQAGGSYTIQEWEELKAKYNYTCLRCGRREPNIQLTSDHVIPVSKHGSSNIDNIQPLCKSCNSWKGQKTHDFRPQNP